MNVARCSAERFGKRKYGESREGAGNLAPPARVSCPSFAATPIYGGCAYLAFPHGAWEMRRGRDRRLPVSHHVGKYHKIADSGRKSSRIAPNRSADVRSDGHGRL